jgi:hypothetical protein
VLEAKTGKVLVDARPLDEMGGVYASPLGAGGRIYLVGRNGTMLVMKASGEAEKLASNKLDDRFEASPVAVGKDLILRGRNSLYCISNSKG